MTVIPPKRTAERALLSETLAFLHRIEWSAREEAQYFGYAHACPACHGINPHGPNADSFCAHGHRLDCELDHLARRIEAALMHPEGVST